MQELDVPTLMHVITSLGWQSVAILHDSSSDVVGVVDSLVPRLHGRGVVTSEEGGGGVEAYQRLRADSLPLHPHLLVLGAPPFVLDLFRQMSQVWRPNTTSPFLFHSQWLTVVGQDLQQPLHHAVRRFTNLAALLTSETGDVTLWTLRHVRDDTVFAPVTSLSTPLPPLPPGAVFPNPLYGLGGRTLRVVVKDLNIYSVLKRNVSGRVVYEGVSIDLLHELSLRANFSYVLFPTPSDNSFGQQLDNGQWDGPVGVLTRREADLAVGYLALTSERITVADATTPYYIEKAAIVFRKDSLLARPDYLSFFFHPFRRLVYVVVVVALLLVLLLLVTIECWRRLGQGVGGGRRKGGVVVGGPGALLMVVEVVVEDMQILVAGLLKQSFDTRRVVSSVGNVLVMTWWLFALVLTSVYSSQLTSSLTVEPRSLPFRSMAELIQQDTYTWGLMTGTAMETMLQVAVVGSGVWSGVVWSGVVCVVWRCGVELIQQDTYTWGLMTGTAMETMLQSTKIKVFQDYYQGVLNFAKTDPSVLSPDLQVHNARVLQGRYAHFIFFDSEVDRLLAYDCRVARIPEPYVIVPYVFYLQKGCPFTTLLSLHIERIMAAGLVTEWRRKRLPANPACQQTDEHTSRVIRLSDTQTAYYLALAGLLPAALVLSLERLWAYTQRTLRHRSSRWQRKHGADGDRQEDGLHCDRDRQEDGRHCDRDRQEDGRHCDRDRQEDGRHCDRDRQDGRHCDRGLVTGRDDDS
ncbi:hypothetical protein ACOMHN_012165 [Nucella lapillus]